MNPFKFRLATLLRVREQTRDQRRAALAEAYRVDEVLRRQAERIAEELHALKELCRATAGPGTVDVDRLVEAQRYEMVARKQQADIGRQRESVAAEIDRRRQSLVEADRDVKLLERLRERQAEQNRAEQQRQDVKRLDEVGIQQAMREVAL